MDYGMRIFQIEHRAIIPFIVETDGVEISSRANKYLKPQLSFIESLFEGDKLLFNRTLYHEQDHVIFCQEILAHKNFGGSIMIIILLNTICLALDRYPEGEDFEKKTIMILNLIFTMIFSFECAVKLIGLGVKEFCVDSFNIFDLVTVLMSII